MKHLFYQLDNQKLKVIIKYKQLSMSNYKFQF